MNWFCVWVGIDPPLCYTKGGVKKAALGEKATTRDKEERRCSVVAAIDVC